MRTVLMVAFEPDGAVITFADSRHFREPGLALTQQLRVPASAEFDSLLADLEAAAERALSEALQEFETAPEFGSEEEPPSPYDNPEER